MNNEKNIYFNEELTNELSDFLLNNFKQWVENEFNKRLTKKGKLFDFTYHLSTSLWYGKKHIMFSDDKTKMKNLNLEVLGFIEEFAKNNHLEIVETQTGGIAKCITLVRK